MKRGRKTLEEKYGLTKNEASIIRSYAKGNYSATRICEIIQKAKKNFSGENKKKLGIHKIISSINKVLVILEDGSLMVYKAFFVPMNFFFPEYNLFSDEEIEGLAPWTIRAHEIRSQYNFDYELLISLLIISLGEDKIIKEADRIPMYAFLGLPAWMKKSLKEIFTGNLNFEGLLSMPIFMKKNPIFSILKEYISKYINELVKMENPFVHPCFDLSFEEIARNWAILSVLEAK